MVGKGRNEGEFLQSGKLLTLINGLLLPPYELSDVYNGLTKVNVGGTTHAPLSCNPRARRRVAVSRTSSFFLFWTYGL